jgi:uncharacterized membrane protein YhaH (DUF805 family)
MRVLRELSWTGRLSRGGFWLRHALVVPSGLFLAIAADDLLGRPWDLALVVLLVACLLSFWVRRLHDRGRSAGWLLLALVPVLGPALLFIECGLRGSASGAGHFGPAPGERGDYLTVKPGKVA